MGGRKAGEALLDAGCAWNINYNPVVESAVAFNKNMRTAVGLGSNIGNRLENLRTARQRILEIHGVHPPVFSSRIYETDPVNCEAGASKFLNAVIEFEFDGHPIKLLEETGRIEESLGRDRHHAKNVSRIIDIDLLYFGDHQIDSEQLRLPHPRMHLRQFVLQPLSDIRPDMILPNQKQTIRRLLAESDPSEGVVRLMKVW